jgi:mannose-6-phosphate isomerase-like protein (cupin superfamily)
MTQSSLQNLKQLSDSVSEKYKNFVVSEVNDACLRLAVFDGLYEWHRHPDSAELFIVLEGELRIEFADEDALALKPGDTFTVPAGKIHRTIATGRTVNLCFELTQARTEFVPDPTAMAAET